MSSNPHKHAFGVVVRVIGLLALLYGLYSGWYAGIRWFGLTTRYNLPANSAILFASFYSGMGLVLLRCANWVVRFAYGPELDEPN
jgi:hypothetical protein